MARILVVEDDDAVRSFTSRALIRDGHDVLMAEDGEIAIETVREHNGRFDLVLSDIRMPVVDGIELAWLVGREFPQLPILLMTGYAEQREQAADLRDIIIDVLPKPFELKDLRAYVSSALEERKAA